MKIILGLILVAVFERLVFDLGPNVELVTMVSVIAGLYLPGRIKWLVPTVVMALSDYKLGVGMISLFTWSGFMLIALLPQLYKKKIKHRIGVGLMAGVSGSIFFYVWTNLGVWLTDSWGMYSRDGMGLWQCYMNAIPFFKNNLLSTMVFVPLGILVMEWGFLRKVKKINEAGSGVYNLLE